MSAGANAINYDCRLSVLIDGQGSEGAHGQELEFPNEQAKAECGSN